jgi:hypothetical protein
MGYYEPQFAYITVTQQWRFHVPARRYFNQALAEVKALLKPSRQCLWKASGRKLNGYQADLLHSSVEHCLDMEPEPSYPDW